MAAKEVDIAELRDEIAKIAFEQALIEVRERQMAANIDSVAKRTWDFVDAFMRERYERTCVKAAMQSPSIPVHVLKGNTIS